MNFQILSSEPRLLLEATLAPIQGTRFQPTGFPDLGAAEFSAPDGTRMLLVESAQSMANRLENVCWDEGRGDWVEPLQGIPHVVTELPDGTRTSSVQEAHRLNSPYITNSDGFQQIQQAIGFEDNKPFDRRKLAEALLRYDPNSLIHGIFLEKVGGTVRLPRALSAFIEARDVEVAPSGGVKVDRVQPATTGENTPYGKAAEGYGNVPYHRDEYAAGDIRAYFNLDLALIRGLGLPEQAQRFLIGFALFKIQKLLAEGMRLRTACDLEVQDVQVKRPAGWELPDLNALSEAMPALIEEASVAFNTPRTTMLKYAKKK